MFRKFKHVLDKQRVLDIAHGNYTTRELQIRHIELDPATDANQFCGEFAAALSKNEDIKEILINANLESIRFVMSALLRTPCAKEKYFLRVEAPRGVMSSVYQLDEWRIWHGLPVTSANGWTRQDEQCAVMLCGLKPRA